MRVDKIIHSPRVLHHDGAFLRPQPRHIGLRDGPHSHPAGKLISEQRASSKDFGQLTGSESPQTIHLPQSILGSYETLQKNSILPGRCFNVRNTPNIPLNDCGFLDRRYDFAGKFRQRTDGKPIHRNRDEHNQNRYAHIDDAHQPG